MNVKYNIKLFDIIKQLSIDNYIYYIMPIHDALVNKLDDIDFRMLKYDYVPSLLEEKYDALNDIIDTLCDYIECIKRNDKDVDKINNLIKFIQDEIMLYQETYGGLKRLKI